MISPSQNDDFSDRPLFGETRHCDRASFLIITIITGIFVVITFASIFFLRKMDAVYIFLGCCLLFILASHVCLAFWYRTGDLEPRFRNMLFYNTAVIISLCICSFMLIKETCTKTSNCF